jgi:hypothetical protein
MYPASSHLPLRTSGGVWTFDVLAFQSTSLLQMMHIIPLTRSQ